GVPRLPKLRRLTDPFRGDVDRATSSEQPIEFLDALVDRVELSDVDVHRQAGGVCLQGVEFAVLCSQVLDDRSRLLVGAGTRGSEAPVAQALEHLLDHDRLNSLALDVALPVCSASVDPIQLLA